MPQTSIKKYPRNFKVFYEVRKGFVVVIVCRGGALNALICVYAYPLFR